MSYQEAERGAPVTKKQWTWNQDCIVCNRSYKTSRSDSKTCGATCRKRLSRGTPIEQWQVHSQVVTDKKLANSLSVTAVTHPPEDV